jgi:hypothetical protein
MKSERERCLRRLVDLVTMEAGQTMTNICHGGVTPGHQHSEVPWKP